MFLLFTLALTMILGGIEVDLFTPSFPELQATFNLSPVLLQLTLSVNFIGYCLSCLIIGPLSDRYGRRPAILTCLGIFIIGSILCVFAPTYWMLILGRFLQGLGISGPAILSFVAIADIYPIEKQASVFGILNGLMTSSMAFAPVCGSFINMYYGWQGNFMTLLIFSVVIFLLCLWKLPDGQHNKDVHVSLYTYIPLLKSRQLIVYTGAICFAIIGYWVFVGIAPLLYMEAMGVDLRHFGYYQGVLAGSFSLVSMLSPLLFKVFPAQICLRVGMMVSLICALSLMVVGAFIPDQPMLITVLMVGYTAGLVFPCNVLYPASLELFPNNKGAAAALVMSLRLIMNAIGVELIGYIYTGKFYPLGIFIGITTFLAFMMMRPLPEWGKAKLAPA